MQFSWPIIPAPKSTKGQLFGALRGSAKPHSGLDMGTGGDTVLAAAPGTVLESRDTKDARGRVVRIDHGADENGYKWESWYMHLASMTVSRGATVVAGDQIAVAGKTGLPKPWPHLHFEVRKDGVAVDPLSLLPPREEEQGGLAWVIGLGLLLLV